MKSVISDGEMTIPAACVPAPRGRPSIFFARSIRVLTSSFVLYSFVSSLLTLRASSIVIPRENGTSFAIKSTKPYE